MGCHANRFADIAGFFEHFPNLPGLYSGNGAGGANELFIAQFLATNPNNFKSITSFAPSGGGSPTTQQIYSWDKTVASGIMINANEPGTTPAYASQQGNGCQ
jgi:hypothetical protein